MQSESRYYIQYIIAQNSRSEICTCWSDWDNLWGLSRNIYIIFTYLHCHLFLPFTLFCYTYSSCSVFYICFILIWLNGYDDDFQNQPMKIWKNLMRNFQEAILFHAVSIPKVPCQCKLCNSCNINLVERINIGRQLKM